LISFSGRPVRDPAHPDYVPSVFSYKQNDLHRAEKKLERFHSVKRRAQRSEQIDPSKVQKSEPDDVTGTPQIEPFEILTSDNCDGEGTSSTAQPTANQLYSEIDHLRKERDRAIEKLDDMKSNTFSFNNLKERPAKFKYYTGITVEQFGMIHELVQSSLPDQKKYKLSFLDQFLMTAMKLRLNLHFETLADMFKSSKTTLQRIFWKWVNILYVKLAFLIKWPDHDASAKTLPHVFRQYFPRLTGIIDCTEIFIERPRSLKARAEVYSNYKRHSTAKVLIACTPQGAVSFVSKVWGGRVSDVDLVRRSGFISNKYHHRGDQILADRGFTLEDEFAAVCGVELIIPSFTKGKLQLSAREVETSRQIASIRIHIERIIGLMKNRYTILSGTMPITMVNSRSNEASNQAISSIDKIITVCAALTNLGDGIVYKEES